MNGVGQYSPSQCKVSNIVLLLFLILFPKNLYIVVEGIEAVCQGINVSADLMRCQLLPCILHFIGENNNLLDLIANDPMFNLSKEELEESMKPEKYIGRSSVQVEDFIKRNIKPILDEYKDILGLKADINV